MDTNHGHLDHIRGRPLDGGVDGVSFGKSPQIGVGRLYITNITPATHEGLHITSTSGRGYGLVHIVFDTRIGSEVLVDEIGGFLPRDAQTLAQAKSGNAINNAKVDCFGLSAKVFVDLRRINTVNTSRCGRVDVEPIGEGLHHMRVAAHRRHNPQLNLAVVCRQQAVVRIARHKSFANFSSLFRSNRNILQIGLIAAQATCGSNSLVVGGMYPTGSGMDQVGEGLGVCRSQFLRLSIIEYCTHNWMPCRQSKQHLLIRFVLPTRCFLGLGIESKVSKEHVAQLPWR